MKHTLLVYLTLSVILILNGCAHPIEKESGVGLFSNNEVWAQWYWTNKVSSCSHGLHHQPNGPFAILLFCEDALGSHAGLIHYSSIGAPSSIRYGEKWSLSNRMWQEDSWGADVTSYAWGPDGESLYIATSDIYGSGGLFRIDLINRSATQIAPNNRPVTESDPGLGFVITTFDPNKGVLQYEVVEWNSQEIIGPKTFTIQIPVK